jgi:L-alanine-DL-glutamate epimerase-like enolase superfamily enzyme
MKITDLRATTVTVPLEAPLRHSNRAHRGPLYNDRTQMLAAIEFACLDLCGKALGIPVHNLLGGKVRDRIPFASYLFYRCAHPGTGADELVTPAQLVEHALDLKQRHGFTTHKLKGVRQIRHEPQTSVE